MAKAKPTALPESGFAVASIADFVALCERAKVDEVAARYLAAAVDSAKTFIMVNGSPTYTEWLSMPPVDRGALVALTAQAPAPPAAKPPEAPRQAMRLPPGASVSASRLKRGAATPIMGGVQPVGRDEP